jgi:hypothetical protein
MKKSYSKIRHIQNSNILLERRLIIEQDETPKIDITSVLLSPKYPIGEYFNTYDDFGNFKNKQDKQIKFPITPDDIENANNNRLTDTQKQGSNPYRVNIDDTPSIYIEDSSKLLEKYLNQNNLELKPNSKFIILSSMGLNKSYEILYLANDGKLKLGVIAPKEDTSQY